MSAPFAFTCQTCSLAIADDAHGVLAYQKDGRDAAIVHNFAACRGSHRRSSTDLVSLRHAPATSILNFIRLDGSSPEAAFGILSAVADVESRRSK